VLIAGPNPALTDDIGCLDMTFKLLSPNDSVYVSAFEDPKGPGATCHISQARKGGWGSVVGHIEDPSQFSIDQENVFSGKTSIFFKSTKVIRMFDKKHNTLVYLAVSKKLIEGTPQNSISTVPIMPWAGK
jgi:CreA protein